MSTGTGPPLDPPPEPHSSRRRHSWSRQSWGKLPYWPSTRDRFPRRTFTKFSFFSFSRWCDRVDAGMPSSFPTSPNLGAIICTAALVRSVLFRLPLVRRLQRPVLECPLLYQGKEHRHQNQNVNGRSDHSSHDRSRNGLHDVRTDSGLPQNRDQAGKDRTHRHQLRTEALNRAFDRRRLDVFVPEWNSSSQSVVKRFMQIDDHDHPCFYSDAKEGDIPYPDCHAEVVAQQVLQDET